MSHHKNVEISKLVRPIFIDVLKTYEPFILVGISLYGFLVLRFFYQVSIEIYSLPIITFILGLITLAGLKKQWMVDLKAVTAAIIAWIVMRHSGGEMSYLLMWNLFLVSTYPIILSNKFRTIYSLFIAGGYLVYAYMPRSEIIAIVVPDWVIIMRSILFLYIGLLSAKMTNSLRELYMQREQRIRRLDAMVNTTLELREVDTVTSTGEILLEISKQLLDADSGALGIAVPESDRIEFHSGSGEWEKIVEYSLPLGQGLIGEVISTGKPILVNDGYEDKRIIFKGLVKRTPSILSVPLFIDESIYGAFLIGRNNEFTDEDVKVLASMAHIAAGVIRRISLQENLEISFIETATALSNAINIRDLYTGEHSENVARLTEKLAINLNLSGEELRALEYASRLHDIGKLGIPDDLLLRPGPLKPEEMEIMQSHVEKGVKILSPITKLANAIQIIYCHHERIDGTGYPRGLVGDEIPLPARILTVVDAYHAMISNRPYRTALPSSEVVNELEKNSGTQFDPEIVAALIEFIRK